MSLQILRLSIYCVSGAPGTEIFPGTHGRVTITSGMINIKDILDTEIAGTYEKYVEGQVKRFTGLEWFSMLVAGERNCIQAKI